MIIIGITGGVGAGKSTILDYLESQYDAFILKSDDAARRIQMPGGAIYEDVKSLLEEYPTGQELLQADGTFHNPEVARRMFAHPELLQSMNDVIHPAVHAYVQQEIARERAAERSYFVLEAALLIECGYNEVVDTMWYIYCDERVRRERLKESRGYSDDKIDRIMASQLDDAQFRAGSDVVIDNSGLPEEAHNQVDKAMRELV